MTRPTNGTLKWITGTFLGVLMMALLALWAYASATEGGVATNRVDIRENTTKIRTIERELCELKDTTKQNRDMLIEVRSDVRMLRETLVKPQQH